LAFLGFAVDAIKGVYDTSIVEIFELSLAFFFKEQLESETGERCAMIQLERAF
jgi:hypothetical protein